MKRQGAARRIEVCHWEDGVIIAERVKGAGGARYAEQRVFLTRKEIAALAKEYPVVVE